MDGKHCVAKAKTAIAPRSADPKFDQLMMFTEPYKQKFLQVSDVLSVKNACPPLSFQ